MVTLFSIQCQIWIFSDFCFRCLAAKQKPQLRCTSCSAPSDLPVRAIFTFFHKCEYIYSHGKEYCNRCCHHGEAIQAFVAVALLLPSVALSCRPNSSRQSLEHEALSPWQHLRMAHLPVWAKHSLISKLSMSQRGIHIILSADQC